MLLRKRLLFGVVFGLMLTVATLAGIEILASAYAPAWPARALVSLEPATLPHEPQPPFNRQPWLGDADNDWGMRDAPRTIDKPAGTVRTLFVGDSFVESRFTPLSLPAAVKQRLPAADRRVETIDLGVPGTDPRSYYYRIRDVGLKLSPDAILLFFYAGNDFMPPDQGYSIWPRLVDESPGASIVGWLMPRTNWLLVNRLNLSNFFQARAPAPPNEEMMIDAALKAPPDERLGRIVAHLKKYNYPQLSEAQITEILSRGDNRFWRAATSNDGEQEFLLGWALDILINWESRDFDVAKNRQDAARLAGNGEVEASFSWLEAADRVARAQGVPCWSFWRPSVSLIPTTTNSGSHGRVPTAGTTFATRGSRGWLQRSAGRRSGSSICARTSWEFPAPTASLTAIGARRARPSWPDGFNRNCGRFWETSRAGWPDTSVKRGQSPSGC